MWKLRLKGEVFALSNYSTEPIQPHLLRQPPQSSFRNHLLRTPLNQRCFLARGEKMKSFQHGGDIRRLAQSAGLKEHELLDFSANINPLGPPEWLRPLISSQVSALQHYPDPHCAALVEAAAVRYGVAQDEVIAGNGSTEILYLLARAAGKSTALIPVPCYGDYSKAALQAGMKVRTIQEGQGLTGRLVDARHASHSSGGPTIPRVRYAPRKCCGLWQASIPRPSSWLMRPSVILLRTSTV